MKKLMKLIGAPVIVAVVLATTPATSRADEYCHRPPPRHNNDGAAVAIFAGIATMGLIAALASQNDRHYDRYDRGYCPPPPPPPYRWVPGHYETQREQVCVPGYWDTVTEPAEYGWVRHGCRQVWVMLKPECARRVWVPERREWRETQVWVPAHREVCRAY